MSVKVQLKVVRRLGKEVEVLEDLSIAEARKILLTTGFQLVTVTMQNYYEFPCQSCGADQKIPYPELKASGRFHADANPRSMEPKIRKVDAVFRELSRKVALTPGPKTTALQKQFSACHHERIAA